MASDRVSICRTGAFPVTIRCPLLPDHRTPDMEEVTLNLTENDAKRIRDDLNWALDTLSKPMGSEDV